MTEKLKILIILLLLSACSEDENDQFYDICDVCSQKPKTILIDSIQIYCTDLISPNSDGSNDVFYLIGETPSGEVLLTEIFSKVSFELYRDNSMTNPVFELKDQEVIFWGENTNGDFVEEGIYTYKLTLDNNIYTRLLGIYRTPFCLSDFKCDDSCSYDLNDPFFSYYCN